MKNTGTARRLLVRLGGLLQENAGISPMAPQPRQGRNDLVLQRLGGRPHAPKSLDRSQSLTDAPEDVTTGEFQIVSGDQELVDSVSDEKTGEVKLMPRRKMSPGGLPILPRMTREAWRKRTKTTVSLTKEELEQLALLLAAGRALLRSDAPVSPRLKAAMTRLGISTAGL